jgi:hypothetical protein
MVKSEVIDLLFTVLFGVPFILILQLYFDMANLEWFLLYLYVCVWIAFERLEVRWAYNRRDDECFEDK